MEEIDVSNFDTSNVTKMAGLFFKCKALKTLDLHNFDTSKVNRTDTNVGYGQFFSGCSNLRTVDVSSFDTRGCDSLWRMFEDCSKLEVLDLRNWNTMDVRYTYGDEFKNVTCQIIISKNIWKSSVTEKLVGYSGTFTVVE